MYLKSLLLSSVFIYLGYLRELFAVSVVFISPNGHILANPH